MRVRAWVWNFKNVLYIFERSDKSTTEVWADRWLFVEGDDKIVLKLFYILGSMDLYIISDKKTKTQKK